MTEPAAETLLLRLPRSLWLKARGSIEAHPTVRT